MQTANPISASASHQIAPDTGKVVLINPYELGRQPFGLAEPAAWLKHAGFDVICIDLSLQKLDACLPADAVLIALNVGMHTATRIAVEAIPRIRQRAPRAHLCVYGLYAPMNATLLKNLGVQTILGGECEPALLALAQKLAAGESAHQSEPSVYLRKIQFRLPDRSGLPALQRYAHLLLSDEAGAVSKRIVGFAEGSRGCKHLCRHCPVVPVYEGKFRIVPLDIVLGDIRQQAASGAEHVSFGDPDFFNGPTHAMKLVRALHDEFPQLSYDATIKIQHLLAHADLLPELKRTGCLFVTSAVESVDDEVLRLLDKNHSSADFDRVVGLMRAAKLALAPTFVAFTPWTTLPSYIALLQRLLDLRLVEAVPPIQLAIRLLIPAGSYLLRLPGFADRIGDFDAEMLGYPWRHSDARVDDLQAAAQTLVAQTAERPRRETFTRIWRLAHAALGLAAPAIADDGFGRPIPHLSEPWYCCAEPTSQQLQSF
ncbi:MAG: radical SAM protein [Burkholderiales bacterium]|nr:radical SAM protein [Burkholderiales bacterium]